MARLSKKEKLRRQRISESLKAYYESRRQEAVNRSLAAQKAAQTRKEKAAKARGVAYHKPPLVTPVVVKVGHGAKPVRRKTPIVSSVVLPDVQTTAPTVKPKPARKKPVSRPELPTTELPTEAEMVEFPPVKAKRKRRKATEPMPEPVRPEPVLPPPVEEPVEPSLFESEAEGDENDTWKGPWRERQPTRAEVQKALDEIVRISESVATYMGSDKIREEYGLRSNIKAWALLPVVNDDSTISGEVRIQIPNGIDPGQLSQELQYALPKPFIENLWMIPIIVYEPKKAEGLSGDYKLTASPFERLKGETQIRAYALKYDDRVGVKAVTGFLKAEAMADKVDPTGKWIRGGYIRIKFKFSERPPRSAYELRRMEEERIRKEREEQRRVDFLKNKGFKPV